MLVPQWLPHHGIALILVSFENVIMCAMPDSSPQCITNTGWRTCVLWVTCACTAITGGMIACGDKATSMYIQ